MLTDLEKAQRTWEGVKLQHIIAIGPLGTRTNDNTLIYNRINGRVQTGWLAQAARPCFHGSLSDFQEAVDKKYFTPTAHADLRRKGTEYHAAIEFLRSLPELAGTGSPEAGLGPADRGESND